MVTFVNGNGLRVGYVIKLKGDLYRVMAAEHRTPGKGRAFMQAKLRNLKDGTPVSYTHLTLPTNREV